MSSFLDKLAQNGKSAISTVGSKSKEYADDLRMEKLYRDLGKKYFENHKEDYSEEFVKEMKSLLDLEKHIIELKENREAEKLANEERRKAEMDLTDHSGDVRCSKCNSWIASDSRFCEVCGCSVSIAQSDLSNVSEENTESFLDSERLTSV